MSHNNSDITNKINEENSNKNEPSNNKEKIEEENEEEEDEEEEEEEDSNSNINNENNEFYENDTEGNENEEEEEDEQNLSLLESYKYKLNYMENIKLYPRPKANSIIYRNSKNDNKYTSNPNNNEPKPSIRSSFTNIEELNSSIKLIRPSQYIIPYKINDLKKSLNLFGINVEPFSIEENQNSIEFIQKIYVNIKNKYCQKILKCEHCNSFFHKLNFNHDVLTNMETYQTNKLYCFMCRNSTYFYTIDSFSNELPEEIKNSDKIYTVPNIDSSKPSIEYIIKDDNNNIIIRNTIQIIVLDLSNKNFINYIYQILIKILTQKKEQKDFKLENNFKYILIAYDINKVYYVHFNNNKNKTIKISIMNDLSNPFCPVDPKKLIYNKNEFIELLDIFYNSFIITKNKDFEGASNNIYNINNSIIKSIYCLIKINNINENNTNIINYYHIIFLSSSHHNIDTNILEENKIFKLYLSFFLILNKLNKNIPFINGLNTNIAKLYYYPINYDEPDDIEQKYQKLNYDLISLLTKPQNYIYDVKMNICYNKNLFNNYFNNDYLYINFIPNIIEFNKLYILPQSKKPNLSESVYFQYNIDYFNLLDNYRHIRLLNFINKISDKEKEFFKSYDEDVLFRTVLSYHISELNLNKNNFASINKLYIDIENKKDTQFLKIIKDIELKMKINFAKNYRYGEEKYNIFIPLSCKCFPLFFYSFVKQISNGDNLNLLNLLYDSPLIIFMKNIYPTLLSLGYKLRKKEEIFSLRPLSVHYLERDQLLIHDNGIYITILINNDLNKRKKEHYLSIFDEKNKKFSFSAESPVLINMMKNKPIKYIYLDDEMILNKKILNIFLEDIIIHNLNIDDDIEKLSENVNGYIQNDISYPNYYEILSANLYEYLD